VQVSQQKLLSGEWSPCVAKSHLKENGIKEDYRNLIVRRGSNCRTQILAKEKGISDGARCSDVEIWQKLEKEKELNPTKYSMAPVPRLWRLILPLYMLNDVEGLKLQMANVQRQNI
jgi:hypothetical protein